MLKKYKGLARQAFLDGYANGYKQGWSMALAAGGADTEQKRLRYTDAPGVKYRAGGVCRGGSARVMVNGKAYNHNEAWPGRKPCEMAGNACPVDMDCHECGLTRDERALFGKGKIEP